MIGFWILVIAQSPEERAACDSKELVLASWEASVAGIDWIEALVAGGKAVTVLEDGYPNRYRATARDVLPVIVEGPPAHRGPAVIGDDYVRPGDWSGRVTIHRDRIAACAPERVVTIEVWDQS